MLSWLFGAAGGATPEDVQRALAAGEACIVLDVRDRDEWEAGHVPGAVWIPLDELPQRFRELPEDKMVYAICRSGARSARAVRFLTAQGYKAKNVIGGMEQWKGELEI
jgi:rhodanese-related sulfurtransferase